MQEAAARPTVLLSVRGNIPLLLFGVDSVSFPSFSLFDVYAVVDCVFACLWFVSVLSCSSFLLLFFIFSFVFSYYFFIFFRTHFSSCRRTYFVC